MKLITLSIDAHCQCFEGEGDYIPKNDRTRMCPECFAERYGTGEPIEKDFHVPVASSPSKNPRSSAPSSVKTQKPMLLENSIGWCDDTTNAVTGCEKVSPGCKNCYAAVGTRARVLRAQGIETWGAAGVRYPVAQFAEKLRRLNKLCICDACHQTAPYESHLGKRCPHCPASTLNSPTPSTFRRIRLFADSNSDWLDEKWPLETLANFLKAIWWAPHVDVLLLTKRPENWGQRLHQAMRVIHDGTDGWISRWLDGTPPQGLWLGVSVENQKYAEERIPILLQLPATVRFLSCEPLLETIDLERLDVKEKCPVCQEQITANVFSLSAHCSCCVEGDEPIAWHGLDWVIVGGESGQARRDCGVEAIYSLTAQCLDAEVPVYVKQDCGFKSGEQGRIGDEIWNLKQFPHPRSSVSIRG